MRLLICRDCRSIDQLPDYHGDPENDVLLEDLSSRHTYPNGERHFGNLATVQDREWAVPALRQQIVEQIAAKTTGMAGEVYATINTYEEDALQCFRRHGRPKEGCIDYKDERKRIGNPHPELARNWRNHPFKVYLCQFCPVNSWVEKKTYDKEH